MKFANENVSKWTIKNYYQEILSLLMKRIKFIYCEEVLNSYQKLSSMLLNSYKVSQAKCKQVCYSK